MIAIVAALLLPWAAHTAEPAPADSAQLEKELQRLPWEQFKSVIAAVPRLKADVEAYGPMGWQFVKARYQTHAWRKNIDKLDAGQKRELRELIEKTHAPAAGAG